MDTYTVGRSRIGHYRKPGSHLTYCGRAAATPDQAARMCRACVKAEALDRAKATATAEAWLDQPPTSPLMAAALIFGGQVEAVDNRRAAEQADAARADASVAAYVAREFPAVAEFLAEDHATDGPTYNDRRITTLRETIAATGGTWNTDRVEETLAAAGMPTDANTCWGLLRHLATTEGYRPAGRATFTEPDPTGGTWRAEWISTRAASAAPTLFDVEPEAEQGALFA